MTSAIYWFRNDLRLDDNPALLRAVAGSDRLLPVYIHDPKHDARTAWGFVRRDRHRAHFLATALAGLRNALRALGSDLFECDGAPGDVVPELARACGIDRVYAEAIETPEEQADIAALRDSRLRIDAIWQSSMIAPEALPFAIDALPDVYTSFRQVVERSGLRATEPVAAPSSLPPLPDGATHLPDRRAQRQSMSEANDPRSSFPYAEPRFFGDAASALAHVHEYMERRLPRSYKETRNQLAGIDYSTKFSPWLANGAISARRIAALLTGFEKRHGANESTYWIWFELLWRDYFRFVHLKYGRRLFHAAGLSTQPPPTHDTHAFMRWCAGETGNAFIDAAMRELAATGYLSNRMRQNAGSYLIHDLACDWRAGAAWFESQLIDYDVYSNNGNWLSLAGRGTSARGGRRFNPEKQAHDYDPDGAYRALWDEASA